MTINEANIIIETNHQFDGGSLEPEERESLVRNMSTCEANISIVHLLGLAQVFEERGQLALRTLAWDIATYGVKVCAAGHHA